MPIKPMASAPKIHRSGRVAVDQLLRQRSSRIDQPDGTPFDLMYRSCDAIEDEEAKLGRGEATMGYSTCLCHSVSQAT
jgi:hypothetical protein